jgi:hypothetical protein
MLGLGPYLRERRPGHALGYGVPARWHYLNRTAQGSGRIDKDGGNTRSVGTFMHLHLQEVLHCLRLQQRTVSLFPQATKEETSLQTERKIHNLSRIRCFHQRLVRNLDTQVSLPYRVA